MDRTYVPEVYGFKVFGVAEQREMQTAWPLISDTIDSPEEVFDMMEVLFHDSRQHEPVLEPKPYAIMFAVLFDCRPAGNISVEGTLRMVDTTEGRNGLVNFEKPFVIARNQGDTLDQLTASGCLQTQGVPFPGGWPSGSYRLEYVDASGTELASKTFDIAQERTREPIVPHARNSGEVPLWIEIDTHVPPASNEPVDVKVNSAFVIEPGELELRIAHDGDGFTDSTSLSNSDRILPGQEYAFVNYAHTYFQGGLANSTITALLAVVPDGELECSLDSDASNRRQLHAFDTGEMYKCNWIPQRPAGELRPSLIQPGWCYLPEDLDVMVPC